MKKNFLLFTLICSVFLFSCDVSVGLGAAVDTEPPTLTIDYPQSGSIIRDTFVLKGSCNDDVKVSRIKVEVIKLGSSPETVGSYDAAVDSENNIWTINLNKNNGSKENPKWDYPDGKYSVDVTAYDDSNRHSGTSSISFTVDNTAPLMILTTPGSKKEDYPSEFGTSIKVNGTIVDDNIVKSMVLTVKDKAGNQKAQWEEKNINTAGGTEVLFAKYFKDAEGLSDENVKLNDRYRSIYDVKDDGEETGDVKYNLEFTLCDEAGLYNDWEHPDKETKGNETSQFYFYDDVVKVWLNDSNGTDYKKVQQIVNGTNTSISDKAVIDNVMELYHGKKTEYATCLINIDASPTYAVSGYSVKTSYFENPEGNFQNLPSASGGSTLTIQAVMGRNKDPIEPKSINAYIFGPFASIKKSIANEIYSDVEKAFNEYSKEKKAAKVSGDADEESKKNGSSSCENYTYSVKVQDDIVDGKCYLVAVTGSDTSDNTFTNDGYFFFKAATSEVPPTIEWKSDKGDGNDVADRGFANTAELKFAGTYESSSPIVLDENNEETFYKVTIKSKEGTEALEKTSFRGKVTVDTENKTWKINLKDAVSDDKDRKKISIEEESEYEFKIELTMKNSGGSNTNSHIINIDTKKPVIKISAITPTVEDETQRICVNGNITLQASVTETALKDVSYEVFYSEDNKSVEKGSLGASYTISKKIDTTKALDNNAFLIKLTATDEAGNETIYTSTEYNSGIPLHLDQSTDVPKISANNFSKDVLKKEDVSNDKNVFDNGSNNKINATITDDDGLDKVYVYYYKEDGSTLVSEDGLTNPLIIETKGTTTYTLNQTLPKKTGIYWVEIKANDTDGHKSTPVLLCKKFCVAVDTANPSIKETLVNTESYQYVKEDGEFKFSGSVSDDWEIKKDETGVKVNDSDKIIPLGIKDDGSWDYIFKAKDYKNVAGDYKLEFIVKDRAGKQTSITRYITIDNILPTLSIGIDGEEKQIDKQYVIKNKSGVVIAYDILKAEKSEDADYWFNVSQIPLNATVSDNGTIKNVEYCTDYTGATGSGSWSSMAKGETSWTGTVSCSSQGKNTIWVKVTDSAENETIEKTYVYIDTVEPDGITSKIINGESGKDTVFVRENGSVVIEIEASENGPVGTSATGIGDVYYGSIHAEEKDGRWILTIGWDEIRKFPTETTSIKLKISDKVENEVSEKVVTIQKDNRIPSAVVNELTDADDKTAGVQINKIVTLSGTAYDNQTLKSIEIRYQKSNAADYSVLKKLTTEAAPETKDEKTEYEKSVSDIANWKVNFDTTDLEKGTYYIWAYVEDAAGNTSTKKTDDTLDVPVEENRITVVVDQDSDRPKIYLTNLTLATDADEKNYLRSTKVLSGTITDDDGVQGFAYSTDGGNTYTNVTLGGGGSWNISISNEGENELYFKVTEKKLSYYKDAVVFVSGAKGEDGKLNQLATPKITDGTTIIKEGECSLQFNLVTLKPDVDPASYSVYNSSTKEWKTSSSLGKVGGIYTKFKVSVKASSKNNIDSIVAVYNNGNEIDFACNDDVDDDDFDGTVAHVWTSDEITVGTDENLKSPVLEITTTDKAGMQNTTSISVNVDNKKPVVNISKPSSLIGSSATLMGTVEEVATLYYGVSRSQSASGEDLNKDDVVPNSNTKKRTGTEDGKKITLATEWKQIESEDSATNWYVYFDDGTGTDHCKKLATYLTEDYLGITTQAAISAKENPFDTITPLYFWIKAVDTCGNETVVCQIVNVDPQGERPYLELSYPVDVYNTKEQKYEYPVLGGTIRMTGTATDNIEAKYVWIQIDSDGKSGFGKDDLFKLIDNDYTIGEIKENKEITNAASLKNSVKDDKDALQYAIMVPVKGSGWNQSINANKEFNPTGEGRSILNFTLYATDQDSDGSIHVSIPVTQTIEIDSKAPYVEVSSLKMIQYKNADGSVCTDGSVYSGEIGASKNYSDGMSIKGVWFITGKFKDDDSGIAKIVYKKPDEITYAGQSYTNTKSGCFFKPIEAKYNTTTIYNYEFQIPLGSNENNSVGTSEVSLEVIDNSENENKIPVEFSVVFDNQPPVLTTTGDNTFKKLDTNIQNSNGFYTFGTIASENTVRGISQSGVERVAFYFTRDLSYNLRNKSAETYTEHSATATETHDLFDIMLYRSGTESSDVASKNTIIDYKDDSNLKLEDGLYWKTLTGSIDGSAFVYTGALDANIHKKGLVKINGAYYLIDGINTATKTITLSGEPGDMSSASVMFALCNVIDKSGEKNGSKISSDHGYGYGYYSSRDTDDGDLITETFTNQGTDWIFDAAVNTKNLPDGPITVHLIAFDKAGNYVSYSYNGVVSNNAPRIVGMEIGTDEDGNGKVDDSEFISTFVEKYSLGYDASGNEVTQALFPIQNTAEAESILTVKGETVMKPKLVGGNGIISYNYDVYNHKSGREWDETAEYSKTAITELGIGTTDTVMESEDIVLPMSDFITQVKGKDQISDGEHKLFKFNFGDSTPGLKQNDVVTNNASISVVMDVALRESNSAKNFILPFYWKDDDDNSLFKESTANGHIDLSKDLPESFKADGTGIYSLRPKASGMIKLEGVALDDTLLRDITVAFDKKFGNITASTAIKIASYKEGTWTTTPLVSDGISAAGWSSEIKQATYSDLKKINLITDLPADKKETDLVPYVSQTYGHVVHWVMYIDTQKIENMAVLNAKLTAMASDRGKPSLSSGKIDYKANSSAVTNSSQAQSGGNDGSAGLSGTYSIDIVPYITGVSTTLDNLYEGTASVYSRTALGKYVVAEGEDILISGFNLAGNAVVSIGTTTIDTNASGNADNALARVICSTTTDDSGNSTKDIAIASGAMTVTVNGVPAINNLNNNDAMGTATGSEVALKYNMMPNRINNNILTDDVAIDIWKFKTAANPRDGEILYPEMQIGPNGEVGFAFVNGNFFFNMAGSSTANQTSTSTDSKFASQRAYEGDYAPYYESALAFDDDGRTFGITTNQDSNTNFSAYTSFYFGGRTSSWNSKNGGNYQAGPYRRRLQSTTSSVTDEVQDTSVYRAMSPTLVTTRTGDITNAYLAFYDAVRHQVRYRWGKVGSVLEQTVSSVSNKNVPSDTYEITYFDKNDNKFGYAHISGNYVANDNTVYLYRIDGTRLGPYKVTGKGGSGSDYYFGVKDPETNEQIYPFPSDATFVSKENNKSDAIKAITSEVTLSNKNDGFTVNNEVTFNWKKANKVYLNFKQEKLTHVYKITGKKTSYNKTVITVNGYVPTSPSNPERVSQISGQFIDACGHGTATESYAGPDPEGTTDQSVLDSLYSIVDQTNATKQTAAVSIGVVPASVASADNDVVVLAWYDGSNRKLKFAYETNPQRDDDSVSGGLFQNVSVVESDAGYNVHIKVDAKGGIHMAYFTTIGSKLKYAYASAYNQPFTVVTVDSYSLTSNDIGIDVAIDSNGNLVPYISYLSGTQAAKIAYPVQWNSKAATKDGMISNAYTGAWEISAVPVSGYTTTNEYKSGANGGAAVDSDRKNLVPKYDTICVGVHKNWSTGAQQAIGSKTTVTNISKDDNDHNWSTLLGGNGTMNPAMAFTVMGDDSLQFAQKN